MDSKQALVRYLLRLGDNALILAQRLIEVVADGPELEEELANANFSLDYLGQARMFYTLAGELEGKGRDEDDLAFHRAEREFENLLLVEQPNGHFGDVNPPWRWHRRKSSAGPGFAGCPVEIHRRDVCRRRYRRNDSRRVRGS